MTILRIDPANAVPIWKQIEDGMRHLVASGALEPGTSAPSVRALATDLLVNPATVARAYQRLVDAGVFVVRRGEGTFVADRPRAPNKLEKLRMLRDGATKYAQVAASAGASFDEAVKELGVVMDRSERAAEGGRR